MCCGLLYISHIFSNDAFYIPITMFCKVKSLRSEGYKVVVVAILIRLAFTALASSSLGLEYYSSYT